MRRRLAVASVAVLAATALAACGSDEPAAESGDDPTATASAESPGTDTPGAELAESVEGLTVTGDFGKEPTVEVDGLDVTEVEAALVIAGDGEALKADGAALTKTFVAKGADGSALSGYEDEPYRLVVDKISKDISQVLTGQRSGSRIALAAPAATLYGDSASQLGLTAEDDVVLVIDLIETGAKPAAPLDGPEGDEVDPPADAPKVVESDDAVTGIDFADAPEAAPAELEVITLVEGTGTEVLTTDTITADYFGAVWGADEPFDDSFSRGEPLNMPLSGLVPGWSQGLAGVPVGSRVLLVIPPELGYGEQGQGKVPPNATLVFVVDVLGVG